jgi:hypothetical protein
MRVFPERTIVWLTVIAELISLPRRGIGQGDLVGTSALMEEPAFCRDSHARVAYNFRVNLERGRYVREHRIFK